MSLDLHKRFYGSVMSVVRELYSSAHETNLNCRYIAVTQPIKYAKHKNNRRVWLTILLVWAISAAIGSPIVLGLNNTPDRIPDLCLFYNTDFIIYSSLSSFYIPCIIMVFLYYNIFKVSCNPWWWTIRIIGYEIILAWAINDLTIILSLNILFNEYAPVFIESIDLSAKM